MTLAPKLTSKHIIHSTFSHNAGVVVVYYIPCCKCIINNISFLVLIMFEYNGVIRQSYTNTVLFKLINFSLAPHMHHIIVIMHFTKYDYYCSKTVIMHIFSSMYLGDFRLTWQLKFFLIPCMLEHRSLLLCESCHFSKEANDVFEFLDMRTVREKINNTVLQLPNTRQDRKCSKSRFGPAAYPGGFLVARKPPPPAKIYLNQLGGDTVTGTDPHQRLTYATFGNPP